MQTLLVWLKRDLRVQDHQALVYAQQQGVAAVALFVIEDEWLKSPECDSRHVDFALHSLAELRAALAVRGLPLLVRSGSAVAGMAKLHGLLRFDQIVSHEETGAAWTYVRDQAIAKWCQRAGVQWLEFAQTGVVRRLRSRAGWAARWQQRMDAPQQTLLGGFTPAVSLELPVLPTLPDLGMTAHGIHLQVAGEQAAHQTLRSFLALRGYDYRKALSSPLSAEDGCSRLSPYLAFGALSLRSVHQATERAIADTSDRQMAYALRGFAGRLRWHCHFMQKLEDQPDIEFQNLARYCDGLRENDFNQDYFAAWCEGRTGFPMVDACMRSLKATGWLNFRMRAMLVSFASYHLWLHWRPTGLFLARQFLDFEPGIHWCQMQMQSGTTGINTLRMYSPTKQAQDHDPDGFFIRRWVPELQRVPLPYLAQPWRMSASAQRESHCQIGVDYPKPIVDERAALGRAKDRMYGARGTLEAKQQADMIQQRHGSRKSGLPPAQRQTGVTRRAKVREVNTGAPSPVQGDLFDV